MLSGITPDTQCVLLQAARDRSHGLQRPQRDAIVCDAVAFVTSLISCSELSRVGCKTGVSVTLLRASSSRSTYYGHPVAPGSQFKLSPEGTVTLSGNLQAK